MSEQPHRMFSFESLEQAFAFMDESEAEANQRVLPEQRGITWGDHAVRVWASPTVGTPPLMIYGQIFTEDQLVATETDAGATADEIVYELRVLRESHARGYRYGQWFSLVTPAGEYGEAHIADLWTLSEEEFQRAQSHDWALDTQVAHRMVVEVRTSAAAQDARDRGNGS
jgi:hypothetical protein